MDNSAPQIYQGEPHIQGIIGNLSPSRPLPTQVLFHILFTRIGIRCHPGLSLIKTGSRAVSNSVHSVARGVEEKPTLLRKSGDCIPALTVPQTCCVSRAPTVVAHLTEISRECSLPCPNTEVSSNQMYISNLFLYLWVQINGLGY